MSIQVLNIKDFLLSPRVDAIHRDPYPFIQSSDYLPQDLFDRLNDEFPDDALFDRQLYEGKCYLSKENDEKFLKSSVWSECLDIFRSRAFIEDLFLMLKKDLLRHHGPLFSIGMVRDEDKDAPLLDTLKRNIHVSHEFSVLSNDAYLTPHTDKPSKIFSLLLYFPPKDWDPSYGGRTSVLRPKNAKHRRNWMNKHLDFDATETVFRSAYEANSVFGFLKTANSWHSVEPIQCPPHMYRRSFNINFQLSPTVQAGLIHRAFCSINRRLEAVNFPKINDFKKNESEERARVAQCLLKGGVSRDKIAQEMKIEPMLATKILNSIDDNSRTK